MDSPLWRLTDCAPVLLPALRHFLEVQLLRKMRVYCDTRCKLSVSGLPDPFVVHRLMRINRTSRRVPPLSAMGIFLLACAVFGWGLQYKMSLYNQANGQARFQDDINTLFQRNGLAFELRDGEVTRISPAVLHDALDAAVFRTGDGELDRLLETAREKFLNKSLDIRKLIMCE